ncbi:MAG TPA: glycosyltransferase [Terracidiphilus sp.]|jgi:cellulose synthase/poly-beta-1,6-N-acetylglucosamine synthase-like glycosyltransferase/peptidoglycan/xylan/chitin deacetylase (PgdA/CDA1 family)/spore germination protein YaaH
MPDKQIFFDPQRTRWKRLRRILDITAVVSTLVLAGFIFNVLRGQRLPELLLPNQKHTYKGLQNRTQVNHNVRPQHPARRKTNRRPSEIPFNADEGLRAAYYIPDDAASYSSFKEHVHQIDLLFPQWLHVDGNSTDLEGTNQDGFEFPIFQGGAVHDPDGDNKVKRVIQQSHEDTEVFPHFNNVNFHTGSFDPTTGDLLKDPAKRMVLRQELQHFFTAFPSYHGLSLDIENLSDDARPFYLTFIQEVYSDLHPRNLRLYVNMPVSASSEELKTVAGNSDAIILMNYDQHENSSEPGPIASQDWFVANLNRALKTVPLNKLICAVGNYGYDWELSIPDPKARDPKLRKPRVVNTADIPHVSDAWQTASDADADLDLDYNSLNPHFEYIDEDTHTRHVVWFLDGVTLLNELRAARGLGIRTFVLWRLGGEDRTMWNVWDKPSNPTSLEALKDVPPGHDVDNEGAGDILRVTGLPGTGKRTVQIDTDEPDPRKKLIIDEHMDVYPHTYTVQYYGYHANEVALSFDDGPDPKWTPKILDILKQKDAKGTFMMIGAEAQENIGLMQRVQREGHEIGNHTYFHPDISDISNNQLDIEVKLTERLFASKLGVQPLFFRPPYDIDEEPDTDDQAAPVVRVQQLGLTIVGNKIDTHDWEPAKKSPAEISQIVLDQLETMKVKPQFRGSVILLHDGGGDRSATVAALPVLIDTLRAHGYKIVSVSALMGRTTAQVMPPLTWRQYIRAIPDSIAFSALSMIGRFIVLIFFVGDVLMSARLILVGLFAVIDRLRRPHREASLGFNPRVAVLIPAYNEEKVIVRTIRSVLNSDYTNLRVIVVDDGSTDRTFEVARTAYAQEIASGRVQVLTKPNGGKAAALNYALDRIDEEFYVGIDADTVIAMDAISKLIPHFEDPTVGAVAGNAKVGNRVNLWTRWQALEYITSQNFERRALNLFNVVTVVPGAIGAWRTAGSKAAGGYPINTVAEDADLTMNLLEQKYKVVYEDRALAFTEAPIDAKGLMRQRFRWSFGILQAVFKHKMAFVRNKAMGLFALPNILIFQMFLPLVSPFIDLMFLAGLAHYLVDRHYHPEAASAASLEKLLAYFGAFLLIDFITSTIAFSLERRHPANKGDGWLLFHIWLQRFAYRQVFSIVLAKTLKRAIDGKPFNWDKLERTAKMSKQTEALTM